LEVLGDLLFQIPKVLYTSLFYVDIRVIERMVKKEAGAIVVALLVVATLGASVASASGRAIGGEYNGSSVDIGSSTFSVFFPNVTIWSPPVAEEEAVEEAAAVTETDLSPYFWTYEGKTPRPPGYWAVTDYQKEFSWSVLPNYWTVNWSIPVP
jgi:hypothetical protein